MYKTEQEEFWSGSFGDNYVERNDGAELLASNLYMFSNVFRNLSTQVTSVIEFGANIGANLEAIEKLLPKTSLSAIEINRKAAVLLKERIEKCEVYQGSILEAEEKFGVGKTKKYDFVLIKGVLIHINPDELESVYESLYRASNKYICIAEYYNPSPIEIDYRGYKNKLFKRDFAGEILKRYKDLSLVDYGFCYSGDLLFPMNDDITWFLLEKRGIN